jgi:peptidoglycan/xylan/chitin deacetylase (PgdA/CDA1 family)
MENTFLLQLSVIIATYNRRAQLGTCLQALSVQAQPPSDFEVVVVVDGSTDGTLQMLAELKSPYPLRIVEQQNRGQCAALNRGAEIAKGRFCLFLDDDIIGTPQLVAEHLRAQNECGGVVGIGQIRMVIPRNADWFARRFAQAWMEHYERLNERARKPTYEDCYGGNMSVSRAKFTEVGGFVLDLKRAYDVELGYRLGRSGLSFVYIRDAVAVQDERKGFPALAIDAERAGAACVDIARRHPPTLPKLLGTFSTINQPERALCRLLLMLKIPLCLAGCVGLALPKRSWTYRWYRLLRRYYYWRGVRRALPDRDTWRRLTGGTPILMYHAFGAAGESGSRYIIPERRFAWQMAWLKWMRYQVISMEEYLRYRLAYSPPPRRSVVITMDDGYADNYAVAYPILRRHRFPATIFVVSGQIGGSYYSPIQSELNGRSMLSWSQIETLALAGIEVGAHTRTHPDLTNIRLEQKQEEIEGSKVELEQRLGAPIRTFSYPFGKLDAQVQAVVEAAGFSGAVTVHDGLNTPTTLLQALRRVEIYGTDSLLDFAIAVHFGERSETLKMHLRSFATRLLSRFWISSVIWRTPVCSDSQGTIRSEIKYTNAWKKNDRPAAPKSGPWLDR